MNQNEREIITAVVNEQYFGILATATEKYPHLSIITYAITKDLQMILFSTPADTRKFQNIKKKPEVSFFIDNNTNKSENIFNATGIIINGTAEVLDKEGNKDLLNIYCAKVSELSSFVNDSKNRLIGIRIKKLEIISNFQQVTAVEL